MGDLASHQVAVGRGTVIGIRSTLRCCSRRWSLQVRRRCQRGRTGRRVVGYGNVGDAQRLETWAVAAPVHLAADDPALAVGGSTSKVTVVLNGPSSTSSLREVCGVPAPQAVRSSARSGSCCPGLLIVLGLGTALTPSVNPGSLKPTSLKMMGPTPLTVPALA